VQTLLAVGLGLLILLAIAGIAIGTLRYRKLRRDELRIAERRRHATSLPPSPYQPSGAIHILADGEEPTVTRIEPALPRLDPEHASFFSDVPGYEPSLSAPAGRRHDDQWALERSFHRSRLSPGSLRALVIATGVLVLLIVVGALIQGTTKPPHSSTTTSSSTTPTSSTTSTVASGLNATWPHQLVDYSSAASTALYHVPSTTYTVTVASPAGNDWIVIEMGPNKTLEYQGDVVRSQSYHLGLTGEGWVSLGSPRSAQISVNGHLVVLPAHLSSPFTLDFQPTSG